MPGKAKAVASGAALRDMVVELSDLETWLRLYFGL